MTTEVTAYHFQVFIYLIAHTNIHKHGKPYSDIRKTRDHDIKTEKGKRKEKKYRS